jgi:hypothetical protein
MNNTALVLSHSTIVIPAKKVGNPPSVIPMPLEVTGSVWSGGEAFPKTLQIVEAILKVHIPALKDKNVCKMLNFKPIPKDWKPKRLGIASLSS